MAQNKKWLNGMQLTADFLVGGSNPGRANMAAALMTDQELNR